MQEIIRKSIRNALVFALIGAVGAAALPFIMTGLSSMGLFAADSLGKFALSTVVNTSLIFGMFGGLEPTFQSAFSFMFGGDKKEEATPETQRRASTLTIEMSPEQEKEIAAGLGNFRERVKNGRVTEESQSRSA